MFSMWVPAKFRVIIFRGEMICEDISAFVLLFPEDFEELLLDGEWAPTPRLDDFCFLTADFFIEAKIGFAKM